MMRRDVGGALVAYYFITPTTKRSDWLTTDWRLSWAHEYYNEALPCLALRSNSFFLLGVEYVPYPRSMGQQQWRTKRCNGPCLFAWAWEMHALQQEKSNVFHIYSKYHPWSGRSCSEIYSTRIVTWKKVQTPSNPYLCVIKRIGRPMLKKQTNDGWLAFGTNSSQSIVLFAMSAENRNSARKHFRYQTN
jgi:hypothetical protein